MRDHLVHLDEILQAQQRIAAIATPTPLVRLDAASIPGELWLKDEGAQPVGSFKLRGAANRILSLSGDERARGVVTYSSGNHAQAVAYSARMYGLHAVVVMPENAPAVKREATEALGAEIVLVGAASDERRQKAEELAAEHGYLVVPPYDAPEIIAGQGTAGLEILAQLPEVDLVLVPVSGGGLLSGIAAAIKQTRSEISVIGVEPELAGDARESFLSDDRVSWLAELTTRTIADGLRAQSLGALNWQHVHAYVDTIITVTEKEIRDTMRILYERCPPREGSGATGLVAEPSGAVAPAALLFHTTEILPYQKAVAVLSGRNVDPSLFAEILSEQGVSLG